RRWFRCPRFAEDPCGYLAVLGKRLRARHYDVIFPPHDEVYLLARVRDALSQRAAIAIPDFSAVALLQSKVKFISLMQELELPTPETHTVSTRSEFERWSDFPCYVKLDTATAGRGVQLVNDGRDLIAAIERFGGEGQWREGEPVLLQKPAKG